MRTPLSAGGNSIGGLARYTSQLALSLAREYPEDQYLMLSDQPFDLPCSASNLQAGALPGNMLERRWWTFGLQRELRRHSAEVFHGVNFAVPFPPSIPAVMTIHDLSPWMTGSQENGSWVTDTWRARTARIRRRVPLLIKTGAVRHVITPSETIRAEVIRFFRIDPDMVTAIPLAAAAHFRPQPPRSRRAYFLYAGMFEPRKNVDAIIAAWSDIRSRFDIDLVIAGPRRDATAELQPQTGLEIRGEVSEAELVSLYSGAIALVYPSHYEGFGLPILEAMQCGTPAIISEDRALVETGGDAALRTGSGFTLRNAMSALLEQPAASRTNANPIACPCRPIQLGSHRARDSRSLQENAHGMSRPSAIVISPEAPYPMHGGGAIRTASLLHYLAPRYDLDLILFRQAGDSDPALSLPPGLARSVRTVTLPFHSRRRLPWLVRNGRRWLVGAPPLLNRFSGESRDIAEILRGRHYEVGVIEHFWCAPYVSQLAAVCERTVLDLHNIESELHGSCARLGARLGSPLLSPTAIAHRRFERSYVRKEKFLLPKFSRLLVTCEEDGLRVRQLAPDTPVTVYRNALPLVPIPSRTEELAIGFSGNFEYHPNITAVRFLIKEIWPRLISRFPALKLRLIGKNPACLARCLAGAPNVETTGPVEDAIAELARVQVVVVPLLTGSGTRLKILEAWAAARPVVSTSIGAAGLEARSNVDIVLADDPGAFAASVTGLLGSIDWRRRIGCAARHTFEEGFTWEAAWRTLPGQVF